MLTQLILAVTPGPLGCMGWCPIWMFLEEKSGSHYIIELTCSSRPVIDGFSEFHSVPNSRTIVYGQYDITLLSQVMIKYECIVIISPMMEAEKHLSPRTPMEKQHSGSLIILLKIGWQK